MELRRLGLVVEARLEFFSGGLDNYGVHNAGTSSLKRSWTLKGLKSRVIGYQFHANFGIRSVIKESPEKQFHVEAMRFSQDP
jgi:hypothetical protein